MRVYAPAIAIALAVLLLYLFVPGVKEQAWTASRMAGAFLAVLGYVLVTTARVQLGTSFSIRPEAREIVTHGLYSRIRNPMYVFVDVMLFGLILVLHLYWLFVILAGLAILQGLQARREAKLLQEKFGQAYLDYRDQTWF
jgi:protein-S-isoprenylcysteine O-methyltransferase Ste14